MARRSRCAAAAAAAAALALAALAPRHAILFVQALNTQQSTEHTQKRWAPRGGNATGPSSAVYGVLDSAQIAVVGRGAARARARAAGGGDGGRVPSNNVAAAREPPWAKRYRRLWGELHAPGSANAEWHAARVGWLAQEVDASPLEFVPPRPEYTAGQLDESTGNASYAPRQSASSVVLVYGPRERGGERGFQWLPANASTLPHWCAKRRLNSGSDIDGPGSAGGSTRGGGAQRLSEESAYVRVRASVVLGTPHVDPGAPNYNHLLSNLALPAFAAMRARGLLTNAVAPAAGMHIVYISAVGAAGEMRGTLRPMSLRPRGVFDAVFSAVLGTGLGKGGEAHDDDGSHAIREGGDAEGSIVYADALLDSLGGEGCVVIDGGEFAGGAMARNDPLWEAAARGDTSRTRAVIASVAQDFARRCTEWAHAIVSAHNLRSEGAPVLGLEKGEGDVLIIDRGSQRRTQAGRGRAARAANSAGGAQTGLAGDADDHARIGGASTTMLLTAHAGRRSLRAVPKHRTARVDERHGTARRFIGSTSKARGARAFMNLPSSLSALPLAEMRSRLRVFDPATGSARPVAMPGGGEAQGAQDMNRGGELGARERANGATTAEDVSSVARRALAATVLAVRRASVLIGVHGAGLANTLFLRPGAVVVELVPFGLCECNYFAESIFHSMAWAVDATYAAVCLRREHMLYLPGSEPTTEQVQDPCTHAHWPFLYGVLGISLSPTDWEGIIRGALALSGRRPSNDTASMRRRVLINLSEA